ncbi:MAG: DUF4870 domain-containing protein [Planctomycetia bacterium]|nr:DUF4870 domain-containing protein [Planctomycetia bacterium]
MSVTAELDKLKRLHDHGTITDEQYERAKAKLLEEPMPVADEVPDEPERFDPVTDEEQETRQWAMFLHLSLLAGNLVPMGGIIAPIAIWQMKKDVLPKIDVHGKEAVNWMISSIIYLTVSIVLSFLLIGIPLLVAVGVAMVVFPVIAAVKANNGEVWRYPLTIRFIK